MPGHKRPADTYAPGSAESAASHALSKADWIDLFGDLYRQCFGETESTPPVIMADALRRAKLLNLPNAAAAQRTHDRMLAKAYAATNAATDPPATDPALALARRLIAYGPHLLHPAYNPDAPSVASPAEALAIFRTAAAVADPARTASLAAMLEALASAAAHDADGDGDNARAAWQDAYHLAVAALYATRPDSAPPA